MTQELKRKLISMVEGDLKEIETALHDNLNPNVNLVSDIAGHLLFSGGKRLRPLLMLLSARLCGHEDHHTAVRFSTIFEYLHAATLLHDDVVDDADIRRGREVAHTRWSAPKVVLTGDFLLARSLSLAADTGIPAIISIMAGITEDMSQGEIDQMEKKGKLDLTEEEYLEIIKRKTAVLIQGACRSGALIAHAEKDKEDALNQYGYHLGMAFQMADDLLDYTADAATLGKKTGADIREGKLTLPLIHALSRADEQDRKLMEKIIANPCFEDGEFQTMVEKIDQYKGIEYTSQQADLNVDQAQRCLGAFEPCHAREVLMMLAEYAVARKV